MKEGLLLRDKVSERYPAIAAEGPTAQQEEYSMVGSSKFTADYAISTKPVSSVYDIMGPGIRCPGLAYRHGH